MEFIQLYNENRSKLTKSEDKLANYIATHTEQVIYDTIKSLGEATHTGDATIVRLCKKLGYAGFSDLKIALAQDSMMTTIKGHSDGGKTSYQISSSVLISSIEKTEELINFSTLKAAVKLLAQAQRIHIFGVGHSGESARDYERTWLRVGLIANAESDPHIQMQVGTLLNQKDVVVGLSLSGHTKDTYDSLKVAKKYGAKVIAITNDLTSPIAKLGDVCLQTAFSEFVTIGTVAGQVSQLYLCDVLAREYESLNKVDVDKIKERALAAIMKKSI